MVKAPATWRRITRRGLLAAAPLLLAGLHAPRPLHALDDDPMLQGFDDAVDDLFETFDHDIEQRFAAMDRAIAQAFAEMDRRLRRDWGEAARLPERKVWVGYRRDRKSRVLVDYERGEITLEQQGATDETVLRDSLTQVLRAETRDLDSMDVVARHLDREARAAAPKALGDGTPGRQAEPEPNAELDQLVDKSREPVVEQTQLRDAQGRSQDVGRITVAMLPNHERLSAARVTPVARHFGQRYAIDLPLILSIMKNESAFNPRAQSHIPAFGLMQLVPASGGRDAFKLVEGQDRAPSPDYLFQPNRNIELGVAYLHILDTRYLRAIRDERSRRHCMIAAYNTGAGNVARAFGGSTNVNSAARQINRMSPDAVYRHLVANLPYRETRQYLPKVVRDQDTFATL